METDTDLRTVPKLRWQRTEDFLTEARSLPRRISQDRLYFHGPGKLGIHYFAESRLGATSRRKWWKAKLRHVLEEFPGDIEGIIVFAAAGPEDIPREFFRRDATGRPFQKAGDPPQGTADSAPKA